MGGGPGAGFAGVGGEEPGDVLGLFERNLAGHDAGEEVGERLTVVGGEGGEAPESGGGGGEVVGLQHAGLVVDELEELELVVVGDEAEAVALEIRAHLRGGGEGGKAFAGSLYFNGSTFGELVGKGFGLAAVGDGIEASVGKAGVAGAGMLDEEDTGLELFSDSVEEIGDGGVERGFGGVGAGAMRCSHGGNVLLYRIIRLCWHAWMIAYCAAGRNSWGGAACGGRGVPAAGHRFPAGMTKERRSALHEWREV